MLSLIQFPSAFGLPNLSTFCMKAETLLKMSGQPYMIEEEGNPSKGPKGKLPALRDGGQVIGDSAMIQSHLAGHYGIDFDAGLSARDRAIAHGMGRMCEERLYWCMVYSRWINEANWPKIRQIFFGSMPPVLRSLIPILAQRGVRANLQGHGLGRHSPSEIYAFGKADIDALAALLGDAPFMMGASPTSLDAIAYPVIANLQIAELPSPLQDAVAAHDNLKSYAARCRALWYPA